MGIEKSNFLSLFLSLQNLDGTENIDTVYLLEKMGHGPEKVIDIGGRLVGEVQPCYVIAEAGSNHDGSLDQAKKLIDEAVAAGADAVKFQIFTAEQLVESNDEDFDLIKSIEFKRQWNRELAEYCEKKSIDYLATPFDIEAVDLLETVDTPAYKIASGDITHHPMLAHIAKTQKPVLLSTGKSSMSEVRDALNFLRKCSAGPLAVFHCVATYPADPGEMNLSVLPVMKKELGIPVGLSDHSRSTIIPALAVTLGASIIEKHFTLSRDLPGPDHSYALEPQELKEMVTYIRLAEAALGDGEKKPSPQESRRLLTGRRGLYAIEDISTGEPISQEMFKAVRPQKGVSPADLKNLLGKKLVRPLPAGEALTMKDFEA